MNAHNPISLLSTGQSADINVFMFTSNLSLVAARRVKRYLSLVQEDCSN